MLSVCSTLLTIVLSQNSLLHQKTIVVAREMSCDNRWIWFTVKIVIH